MSQDDFNAGVLVIFMWLLTIALSIGSGILAWNWIEPHNFWMAILFIIVWGLFTRLSHFIAFGIIMSIFNR